MVDLSTAKLGDLFVTRGNANGFMLLELEAFNPTPVPIWVFKDKNSSGLRRYAYTLPDGVSSPPWWTRPCKLDIVAKVSHLKENNL